MDKIEGKITDCDQSGVKQPQFSMPLNFYENQSSYAAANKLQSAPLAFETDQASCGGASTSMPTFTYAQNLGHNTRTDQGQQ
jgi:hypothetical protein